MRFLLDAQLSKVLARHLEEQGYQASHIFEHLRRDADDREIADFVDIARRGLCKERWFGCGFPICPMGA